MKFTLLSRAAAAALAAGNANGGDDDAGPEPGKGAADGASDPTPAPSPAPTPAPSPAPTPSDGGASTTDEKSANSAPVDVVAAADVKALTAEAHAKGFAEANARMKAVFDSPEGKADASTAAFLLATSSGSADDIIGHLKGRSPAPAPTAAIPNTGVTIATDPKALAEAGDAADVDKSWDAALEKRAAGTAPIVPAANAANQGTIAARAIPRTGN
jgi:hypothetical protein